MEVADYYEDNGDQFIIIEIAENRFICVKKMLTGTIYVMENEDGTEVFDSEGNPIKVRIVDD